MLKFSVLTVCTGNLVRSPIAAQLLVAGLGAASAAFSVSSAGTAASVGAPMPPEAVAVSRRYGGDPDQHRARRLTAHDIAGAGLVLTASREHRARVVSLAPSASARTFTIRQFARLVESLDDATFEAPAEFVAGAAAQRGLVPPLADPASDDLDDPFLRPQHVYDRVGAEIDAAITTIVIGLRVSATSHAREA